MKKLLVIRNDKIGDFMLAWPAFALLKKSLPNTEITALVPSYTKELALLCPSIDKVIIDCGENGASSAKKALIDEIKQNQFDASICFFSSRHNARLVWQAGILKRFAPATKWWQIFYNQRITQRRSQSLKAEFEYNIDLSEAFLAYFGVKVASIAPPYLHFSDEILKAQRAQLAAEIGVDVLRPWIFVHAGSGGSANNLSLEQYAALLALIKTQNPIEFVLTAGPDEVEKAKALQALLATQSITAKVYDKNQGLLDFTRSIACASLFIAGSTGPLHIAGSLDVPTIGFFPAKRSATPVRWRPINSPNKHLAFAPPSAKDKEQASDMSKIVVSSLEDEVNRFIHSCGL